MENPLSPSFVQNACSRWTPSVVRGSSFSKSYNNVRCTVSGRDAKVLIVAGTSAVSGGSIGHSPTSVSPSVTSNG